MRRGCGLDGCFGGLYEQGYTRPARRSKDREALALIGGRRAAVGAAAVRPRVKVRGEGSTDEPPAALCSGGLALRLLRCRMI